MLQQMSWRRVLQTFVKLGCVVYRNTDFAAHLNRGAMRVAVIRKIDPVTRKRQLELVGIFEFTVEEYLAALAGTGPPISDDGWK